MIAFYIQPQITILFISFMSNRKYSYIFSPVLSSGNISSQSLTGLYNLCYFRCMDVCLFIESNFLLVVHKDEIRKYYHVYYVIYRSNVMFEKNFRSVM